MRNIEITLNVDDQKIRKFSPVLVNSIITILLILLMLALTLPLRSKLGSQNLILIYSLFVLITSCVTEGYVYGFISAIISTLLFDVLMVQPWNQFVPTIKLPLTLAIMLAVTMISSIITAHMKKLTLIAKSKGEQSEHLYQLNRGLLNASDQEAIMEIANNYIVNHIHRSIVFYLDNPAIPDSGFFSQYVTDVGMECFDNKSERRVATYTYTHQTISGHKTSYDYDGKIYYIPILSKEKTLAVLGISCHNRDLYEKELGFIRLVNSQIALALEREMFETDHQRMRIESERVKTRNSLLRAISHDIRTPLTNILGAANTLVEEELTLEHRVSKKLIFGIKDETEWLIRVVENLLSVSKIADQNMHITKTDEAAEEIISEAVRMIRKWYPDWSVHVKTPDEFIMVHVDPTLISQVLINLMENSVKSSTPNDLILVNLKKEDGYAVFEVSDHGRGISEELLENLFDAKPGLLSRDSDINGRAGIGLTICSTIVQAHGGTICGYNKEKGGASFVFKLPLQPEEGEHESGINSDC